MKCPNCQHDNPPEAAFCMQCGTPLRIACASCGATLPAQARFCLRCGQSMFEYYRSPDGHFGLVDAPETAGREESGHEREVRCPTCGARYRLLERVDPSGQPVTRA